MRLLNVSWKYSYELIYLSGSTILIGILKKKLITSISTRKKIRALGPRISLLLKNYYIFSMECHAKGYFGNRLLVLKCLRLI